MLPFPYKGLYNVSLKVIFIPVKNDNFTGANFKFLGNKTDISVKCISISGVQVVEGVGLVASSFQFISRFADLTLSAVIN